MIKYYEVEYTYYKYNSGAADNGNYTRIVKKDTVEAAMQLAKQINENAAYWREQKYDRCDRHLNEELIPYGGFFIEAKVFECQRAELEQS